MPREHKKKRRGPRTEKSEKKRKLDVEESEEGPTKRQRHNGEFGQSADFVSLDAPQFLDTNDFTAALPGPEVMAYYGHLDDEEKEYFKRADEMLELNQFGDSEERELFLSNVYREADGKELKIAVSQSCSKLMERLILLSTPTQLKSLFKSFSGHFLNLIQHRFASHCCEKLFMQAAPVVSQELLDTKYTANDANATKESSMEALFLDTLGEMDGNYGYLMMHRFASHTLRVLLVVLSGEPLERPSTKSVLSSKRKEQVQVTRMNGESETSLDKRAVPESFTAALSKTITDSVAGLDTVYLRSLATHTTGSPTLQLLLKLELTSFGKQKAKDQSSIIRRLLPDDPIVDGTESASFISGLIYDSVGAHLLEVVVENAPSKMFKALHKGVFKERILSMARNETAGYVAAKILERLGKDDLEEMVQALSSELKSLTDRGRTSIIRTLIERCAVRGVDTTPIAAALEKAYSGPNGFEIATLLKLGEATPDDGSKPDAHPEKVHGSLLAQAMVAVSEPLSTIIFEALTRLGPALSLKIAKDPAATRAIQAALTSANATVIARRKIIQHFYGHVSEMALDPAASRVIDAIWHGTHGLAFIRERIAEELAENEAALRESHVGRAVWRNWKMDLYKRRRTDWVQESRSTAGNDLFRPFPDTDAAPTNNTNGEVKKPKGIELARARHAAEKQKKEREKFSKKTKGKQPAIAGALA